MKMNEMKAKIMDKTAEEAKKIVKSYGYEIMGETVDSFDYSNGAHVFTVSFDDEGVWNVYKVCSVGEWEVEGE